jgi:hypothetical protein
MGWGVGWVYWNFATTFLLAKGNKHSRSGLLESLAASPLSYLWTVVFGGADQSDSKSEILDHEAFVERCVIAVLVGFTSCFFYVTFGPEPILPHETVMAIGLGEENEDNEADEGGYGEGENVDRDMIRNGDNQTRGESDVGGLRISSTDDRNRNVDVNQSLSQSQNHYGGDRQLPLRRELVNENDETDSTISVESTHAREAHATRQDGRRRMEMARRNGDGDGNGNGATNQNEGGNEQGSSGEADGNEQDEPINAQDSPLRSFWRSFRSFMVYTSTVLLVYAFSEGAIFIQNSCYRFICNVV